MFLVFYIKKADAQRLIRHIAEQSDDSLQYITRDQTNNELAVKFAKTRLDEDGDEGGGENGDEDEDRPHPIITEEQYRRMSLVQQVLTRCLRGDHTPSMPRDMEEKAQNLLRGETAEMVVEDTKEERRNPFQFILDFFEAPGRSADG